MARITLLPLLFIFLSSCIFDSSAESEDDAISYWGEWQIYAPISIVNDSLVLMPIYKAYYKEWHECGLFGCTDVRKPRNYRIGLFLVNYREKQKPLWGDTLESNLVIVDEYFMDSSVLVFDRSDNKFGFWKIGTKAKDVKLIDYTNNSDKSIHGYTVRPFTNGNIAFFSEREDDVFRNSFLLETKNRQLKPFEFSEEYEWLSKCANSLTKSYGYELWLDDGTYTLYYDYNYDYVNVSYVGGKLACIKGNEIANNFELTVNNVVKDTISLNRKITNWYGNFIKDAEGKIYKIDTLNFKFDNSYTFDWVGSNYSVQDLMEYYK